MQPLSGGLSISTHHVCILVLVRSPGVHLFWMTKMITCTPYSKGYENGSTCINSRVSRACWPLFKLRWYSGALIISASVFAFWINRLHLSGPVFVSPTWSAISFPLQRTNFPLHLLLIFFFHVGVQREMLLGKCCLATTDGLFLLWLISPGRMEWPRRRGGSVWSKLLNYGCFSLPVCLPLSLAGVICIHLWC